MEDYWWSIECQEVYGDVCGDAIPQDIMDMYLAMCKEEGCL